MDNKELRLECIKIAANSVNTVGISAVIVAAKELSDFVIGDDVDEKHNIVYNIKIGAVNTTGEPDELATKVADILNSATGDNQSA